MPGPPATAPRSVAAVQEGEVPAATVRDRACAVLRLMEHSGALTAPLDLRERPDDRPEHGR